VQQITHLHLTQDMCKCGIKIKNYGYSK